MAWGIIRRETPAYSPVTPLSVAFKKDGSLPQEEVNQVR